jgi:AAA ATPase domain
MAAQLIHRRYSRPVISGDPLMGRDNELALIRRTLGGVGKRAGVVIVGAPGVGKTRLAREVITRAATAGDRTHWIVGTESARPLPLSAFTPAISHAMSEALPNVRRLIDSFVPQQRQSRALIGVDDAASARRVVGARRASAGTISRRAACRYRAGRRNRA